MWGDTSYCDLFGKQALNPSDKTPIVICEGELDAASIQEVFPNSHPAVSTGGTGSAVKAITKNLEWLSKWAYVILLFDNDKAGQDATDKCIGLFEPGKVRVARIPLKDPNQMIQENKHEELKRCIWNAEILKPKTIVTVAELLDKIIKPPEKGIPWPFKFMNDVTYGLLPAQLIVLMSSPGIGKTLFLQELISGMLDKNLKAGIFSFEEKPELTLQKYIGSRLNRKLNVPDDSNLKTWDDTVPLIQNEAKKLLDKIYLYNNIGSLPLDLLLSTIRYVSKCYKVDFIILDNLSALCSIPKIDNKSVNIKDYIPYMILKLHSVIKELGITLIVVSHLNSDRFAKSTYVSTTPKKQDKDEESGFDVSADFVNKMANKPGVNWETGRMPAANNIYCGQMIENMCDHMIALARNKLSEDLIERNTLKVKFLKTRGETALLGKVFEVYYDDNTGNLKEDIDLNNFGEKDE